MTIFRKPNPKTGSAAVARERLKDVLMDDRAATRFPRGITSADVMRHALSMISPSKLMDRFR